MLSEYFTRGQFEEAARDLSVELAAVIAVAKVEAGEHGPFVEGKPTLLFERHKFWRHTGGRFGVSSVSNPEPGGYGKTAAQWARLNKARALDEEAALKSASIGAWQILGENHAIVGYPRQAGETSDLPALRRFYAAMEEPAAQLAAFVAFVKANKLAAPLRTHNWLLFARVYNGPAQRGYDVKIRAEYEAAKGLLSRGLWFN
jgi:hypothetical protein